MKNEDQYQIDKDNAGKWREALIKLLKAAAKDDVFLSMSPEFEGHPNSNPYTNGTAPTHHVSPENGGHYDYTTMSHLSEEPVQITERQAIAKVFITSSVVMKHYVQPNPPTFSRERVAFDTTALPKKREHQPLLILDVKLRSSNNAIFHIDAKPGTLPFPDFMEVPETLKQGVLSKLTGDATEHPSTTIRHEPVRAMGENEFRDPRRSLLDEVNDPGIFLSIEKAKAMGINTGAQGVITGITDESGKERTLGDEMPVFISIKSIGSAPVFIAHQVAEFFANHGFKNVNLKATHSIEEVETMMRVSGNRSDISRSGVASWAGSPRPIIIELDESKPEDTRTVHRVRPRNHSDGIRQAFECLVQGGSASPDPKEDHYINQERINADYELHTECAASGQGHSYGPYGPNSETTCQYCGDEKPVGVVTELTDGVFSNQITVTVSNLGYDMRCGVYVAHEISRFLAERGYNAVNLLARQGIDEYREMAATNGHQYHPDIPGSDLCFNQPIVVALDEGLTALNDQRKLNPVTVPESEVSPVDQKVLDSLIKMLGYGSLIALIKEKAGVVEKVFDVNNPADSNIEICITGDSRQSGKGRLAHRIAQTLANDGYSGVTLSSFQQPSYQDMLPYPGAEWLEATKKINIHISDTAPHGNVAEAYKIEPNTQDKYDAMREANPTTNKYGPTQVTICTQPEEPFFVLLGRDPQAPALVDQWAVDRNQMEMGNPKVVQAMQIAELMREWKEKNRSIGMSKNLYEEKMTQELMYLVPRDTKYSEQEILQMAMVITEAAVLSDVALNVHNNTCFTHLGSAQPVEQQIGQATRIAQAAGKKVVVLMLDEMDNLVMAWGDPGYLRSFYGSDKIDSIDVFRPGEYPDFEEQEALEIPGLNVMADDDDQGKYS